MDYWWDILNLVLIFSIFSISLNLLIGYTGLVSVAHAAFGAIGGYVAAYLAAHAGTGFWPGLFAGVAGAGIVGMLVSLPALGLTPEYLILLTIAVSSIVIAIVSAVPELGGTYGIVGDRPADLWPFPGGELTFPHQWVIPLLVFAGLIFALCHRLGESAWGRVLRGIREDETATRALGRNTLAFKVVVFALTAAMAGVAGVLLFYYNQLASPNVYGLNVSLEIFAMVIFGGLGNLVGSILGAAVLLLLQPLLETVVQLDPGHAFLIQLIIYGLGLALLMRVRPRGLLPEDFGLWRKRSPAPAQPEEPAGRREAAVASAVPSAAAKISEPILQVRGLAKRFGGITACRDLNLDLQQGNITALVGPNGAGKTTVFNLLTGTLQADEGTIRLRGEDVRGYAPDVIARKGMVRSFQDVRLFGRLTALDNVMLGVRQSTTDWWRWPSGTRGGENLADLLLFPRVTAAVERENRAKAAEWLRRVGLIDEAHILAGALAFGQQKLVSLARLLATEADVLLLDEPASGIDSRWVDNILDLVTFMRRSGKTVCIVEHSLHVVEQLADTVVFMELGHVTAQGTMAELTRDPRLAEAYFGTL